MAGNAIGGCSPVLIAGAGIGGLASALALAKAGLPSHVFEKRAEPSEDGAGIQIGPNGVRVLRHLGVADALVPLTASPQSLRVMDGVSGRQLTDLPLGAWIEERHGAPYWSAHRADLHSALLQTARRSDLITLSLGREVQSAHSTHSAAEIAFSDGEHLAGPLLIAADGLRSRLRETIFKTGPLRATGRHAYRAVIPAQKLPRDLPKMSTHIWLSSRAHVVHYPVRGGQEIAIVAVLSDGTQTTEWGTDVPAPHVLSAFEHSAGLLRSLLDAAEHWRGWTLMAAVKFPPWVEGRIALLGDAAHPIQPFLAQGAVMALEDAATLARFLKRPHGSLDEALQAYAAARATRTAGVAAASERNGRIYHLSGPLALARNAALRSIPPQRLMARYDWLYGWQGDENGAI